MPEAGYTPVAAEEIRREADHFEKVGQEGKITNGGDVDMKSFEHAMRHLLNTYIHAGESKRVSALDELGLVELLIERQPASEELLEGIRKDEAAIIETIKNNGRKVIARIFAK